MPRRGQTVSGMRYIDLFCGIGGFRIAADSLGWNCVLSCDVDPECRRAYRANFGEEPWGDIRELDASAIPDHDILVAGFPCQPFSIIGDRRGFGDTRGTLFFEIARILEAKRPRAFVLENVKQLATHQRGTTLRRIVDILHQMDYSVEHRIFNALDFGLPQKRERVFVVGMAREWAFEWPAGGIPMTPLSEVLEKRVPRRYYASDYIRKQREAKHTSRYRPGIWHENKAGNVSSHPFSCALRAGASYNYLLVNGKRRLTTREMLRLQGFPDTYEIVCNYAQTRKQAGNAVPVPVVAAVLSQLADALSKKTTR